MRIVDSWPGHRLDPRTSRSFLLLAASLTAAGACSSNSDSEVQRDGGAASGGSVGTGGGVGTGSGGTSSGGTSGGSGGSGGPGSGGTGGAAGTGGSSGACAARTQFTEASHSVLDVTWQAGTATLSGSGQVHLWTRNVFTVSGNTLTGTAQACGSVLPPTGLTGLVGGGMILIEIPNSAWDAATMAKYTAGGMQTGWDVGSTVTYDYAVLVGLDSTASSTAAWPMAYTGITGAVDADDDQIPGLTALPRNGGGYVLPPTSTLGAVLGGARADKVSIVTRNVAAPSLTRTSCDEAAGMANITHFDNHVIGCHIGGGGDCDTSQIKFIDDNRTVYVVGGGTIKTKVVADGATCADVRAALPM